MLLEIHSFVFNVTIKIGVGEFDVLLFQKNGAFFEGYFFQAIKVSGEPYGAVRSYLLWNHKFIASSNKSFVLTRQQLQLTQVNS